MREIKFRAWDTKKQIFVPSGDIIFSDYGDTRITVDPNCMEYIGDSCHNYNEDSRFKVTQYTGLKDKNGVEIYEGDIIKAIWSKDCEEDIANEIWIGDIFFNCGSFDINSEWCVALNCFNGALEVIGNIYENKELLK